MWEKGVFHHLYIAVPDRVHILVKINYFILTQMLRRLLLSFDACLEALGHIIPHAWPPYAFNGSEMVPYESHV